MKLSILSLLFTAVLANGDAVDEGHRMLTLNTTFCGAGPDACCVGSNVCSNAGASGEAFVLSRSCIGEKAW